MHPSDILSQEHRAIEGRLDHLEQTIRSIQAGGAFSRRYFEDALDFFRDQADGCHHAKEEKLLFPRMVERGVPAHGGPIGVMLAEHDEGRAYLKAVRENLTGAEQGAVAALNAVLQNAAAYIEMLRAHIQKEDNILFRIAKMVLDPSDVAELQQAFAEVGQIPVA
jgi:hemerythrin-like domain-containing protein